MAKFIWYCPSNNNASNWKDYDACGARSRKSWKTAAEAQRAGDRHQHAVQIQEVIRPSKARKRRR